MVEEKYNASECAVVVFQLGIRPPLPHCSFVSYDCKVFYSNRPCVFHIVHNLLTANISNNGFKKEKPCILQLETKCGVFFFFTVYPIERQENNK